MSQKKYFLKAHIYSPRTQTLKFIESKGYVVSPHPTQSFGPVFSRKTADAAFLIIIKKRNVVACEIVEEKDK